MKHTLILMCIWLTACNSGDWNDPGPRETFEAFLLAAVRGEPEKMYELVDPDDRKRFEATRASIADLDPKVVPEKHEMVVVGRLISSMDIRRIDVSKKFESKPKDGETVELAILLQDDTTVPATMVWRVDQWFLDFPRASTTAKEPAPNSAPAHNGKSAAGKLGFELEELRKNEEAEKKTP